MKVLTAGGNNYQVSDEQGQKLMKAIESGVATIRLNGALIKTSSIMEIVPDSTKVLKQGEWLCESGHVHPRSDGYCNVPRSRPGKLLSAGDTFTAEQRARARAAAEKTRANLAEKLGWKK